MPNFMSQYDHMSKAEITIMNGKKVLKGCTGNMNSATFHTISEIVALADSQQTEINRLQKQLKKFNILTNKDSNPND